MIDGNSALALCHAVLTSPRGGGMAVEWSALLDAFEEAGLPTERMRWWDYELYEVPVAPEARSQIMVLSRGDYNLAAERCRVRFASELEKAAYLRAPAQRGTRHCHSRDEAAHFLRKMLMTDAGAEMFGGLSGGIW